MFNKIKLTLLIFAGAAAFSANADKACLDIHPELMNLRENNLALEGFDPVAYFPEHGAQAVLGDEDIRIRHCGVLFYFSNEEHRAIFLESPEKFIPGFAGFNPYSMSIGALSDVLPNHFDTSTGELLMFVNETTKSRYLKDEKRQQDAKEYFEMYYQ